jgi:hypothetical protein
MRPKRSIFRLRTNRRCLKLARDSQTIDRHRYRHHCRRSCGRCQGYDPPSYVLISSLQLPDDSNDNDAEYESCDNQGDGGGL